MMPVKVLIPTALEQYVGRRSTVEVLGSTVGEVVANLAEEYPDLRRHLLAADGHLRSFVNLYVKDEDVRGLQRDATPIRESDVITIIPSIAGGTLAPEAAEAVELSNDEVARYSRHLIMPEVGVEGQKKLKAASILLVGTGGLGAPLGLYLAAAGVGRLGLVDFDVVDYSNLQRQVIHGTKDVGRPKLLSAADRIRDINPFVALDLHETMLSSENALEIGRDYDIIIDGTDNFPTRYLVNDACVLLGKPNVYGSIFRFDGQATVFWAEKGPCYRCLYPEPPPPGLVPSCAEGGVLGVLPGIVGTIQATEAIKLILGEGDPLIGRLLLFDAMRMKFRELKLRKDPDCPVCGTHPTITKLIDYQQFCGITPPHAETGLGAEWEITPRELKARLDRGERPYILDVRNPGEWEITHLKGAHLIPLPDLPQRLGELDPSQEIILHCKSGKRSQQALEILRDQAGFRKLKNLKGGIDAWAEDVDPTVPRY
jgi:sulfur-carrier protein adenylyltransferase/sulfurtransferase